MWRGDRGASCTPLGKGQRGVVAVYLIDVPGDAERLRDGRCCSIGCKRYGCLVELPYHTFGCAALKAEDDAS
jgi:hypothetical protein